MVTIGLRPETRPPSKSPSSRVFDSKGRDPPSASCAGSFDTCSSPKVTWRIVLLAVHGLEGSDLQGTMLRIDKYFKEIRYRMLGVPRILLCPTVGTLKNNVSWS